MRVRPRALTALVVAALAGCSGGSTASLPEPEGLSAAPVAPSASGSTYDWPVYHGDRTHSGFDATAPVAHRLSTVWRVGLDGAVYGSPVVVDGTVVVATENDSVYAVRGGKVVWRNHLGTPVPLSRLPCGNIDPLGITGTPAYDPSTGSVFVVEEIPDPYVRHVLVALDARTGAKRWSRTVDRDASTAYAHQQRAALALSHGRVYVAFGGLAGDCGPYHGYVVSARTDGSGPLSTWVAPTSREGGIWAAGGPVVDSTGDLFVPVGNGASTGGAYDGSDSVTKLSAGLTRLSYFAPQQWAQDNAGDVDLGSTGPALVAGYVFIAGKSRVGYLLDPADLGGIGGQRAAATVCGGGGAFGGAAVHGSRVFVPCTDGVRAVRVAAGPRLVVDWRAPSNVNGSPVAGGGMLWSLDTGAGVLYGLDPTTGQPRLSASVGAVTRFATPALYSGRVLVGTRSGLVELYAG